MIAIFGFGRFGKLMARYLSKDFDVCVHTRSDCTQEIEAAGASSVSFENACKQRTLILAVPISAMQKTLARIAPKLHAGSLVVDVCSVKEYPVRLMQELLPREVSLLATHPMFGPDSAADSLEGCKIVVCRERVETAIYQKIVSYLKSKGLVVIETSAGAHDRQIATSLALTHFIGRTLSEFGAVPLDIDTEGYQRLLHVLGVVENDTWQLFEDMNTYNPYAAETRQAFLLAVETIHNKLPKKPL